MTRTVAGSIGIEHEIGADRSPRHPAPRGRRAAPRASRDRSSASTTPIGDLERRVQVERGEGSLSLRVSAATPSATTSTAAATRAELVIDVPTAATVVVETASAEVTVEGLTGDQRYRTSSGDISLRDVSGTLVARDGLRRHRRARGEDLLRSRPGPSRATCPSGPRTSGRSGPRRPAATSASPAGWPVPGRSPSTRVSGDMLLALAGDVRLEASTVAGDVTSGGRARTRGQAGSPRPHRRRRSPDDDRPLHVRRHQPGRADGGDPPGRSASADPTVHARGATDAARTADAARDRRPAPADDSPTVVVDHDRARRRRRGATRRSCAPSSAARSTSPRPAAGSSAARSRGLVRCLTTPWSRSSGWSPRAA